MESYTLVIDNYHPPKVNSFRGRHWRAEGRLKREAADLLAAEALAQGVPRAAGRRRVSLLVVLGPGDRQPDRDAYDKALLDALVRAGLLLDDGERGLEGRVAVAFDRGPGRRTELLIEDLGPREPA